MASESTEEGAVTVELPPELDEWLDERAGELGEPREDIVRQLLASYRTTTELDGESLAGLLDIESAVEDAMQDQLDAAVAAAVEEELENRVETRVRDRLPDITDAVESRLDNRFATIDENFQGKITDVRERVVQLKREIDAKAPADHAAFETVEKLDTELQELNRELVSVRDDVEDTVADQSSRVDDIEQRFDAVEQRLEDTEDKLKRVAWVVSDLREDQGGRDAHQKAVNRIKRAAAQEGITSASCQSCGESVEIGLLADPQCEFIDDGPFSQSEPEGPADSAADPFSGMDDREEDPFDDGENVFESVDIDSVDADEVWNSLDEEPDNTTSMPNRYADVSKHRFCEQCEFFASPPGAHCTNEDAEILEFLDMETVRVLNCPIVAEQRELADEE